jgi:hypothetical protein
MHNPSNSGESQAPEIRPAKKPYQRPTVRRLGTVRELTQAHPSRHGK